MASRIKGLVVTIDGETTGLEKALKRVNGTIRETQSKLRDVEKLLKLDPSNITLSNELTSLGEYALSSTGIEQIVIPATIKNVANRCFNSCKNLKRVIFLGKPNTMNSTTLTNCPLPEDIYVCWSMNGLANEPWGADNATVHYGQASVPGLR